MAKSNRYALLAALACAASVVASGNAQQPIPPEVAQAPSHLTSSGRIAPEGEPGVPIVISGTLVAPDGKTPAGGVTVYAYQTDAKGQYRRSQQAGENGENEPRLRGWVKTDDKGHFEFATIRPAPYPSRNVPAHLHLQLWGAGFPRQWFELENCGSPKSHLRRGGCRDECGASKNGRGVRGPCGVSRSVAPDRA